jgi:hypothetical protein
MNDFWEQLTTKHNMYKQGVFDPKMATTRTPSIWLAKILVKVLCAYDYEFTKLGQNDELDQLATSIWHVKRLATI